MSAHHIELPDPFPPGARKLAFVAGLQVLVCNVDGALVAFENTCPHAGGSLYSGKIEGRWLRCPSHGMKFDLLAGGGGTAGLRHYPIAAAAGGAVIELPEG